MGTLGTRAGKPGSIMQATTAPRSESADIPAHACRAFAHLPFKPLRAFPFPASHTGSRAAAQHTQPQQRKTPVTLLPACNSRATLPPAEIMPHPASNRFKAFCLTTFDHCLLPSHRRPLWHIESKATAFQWWCQRGGTRQRLSLVATRREQHHALDIQSWIHATPGCFPVVVFFTRTAVFEPSISAAARQRK